MKNELISEKNKQRKVLKDFYKLKNRFKPIGLVILSNNEKINFLKNGFKILPSNFVIITDDDIKENYLNIVFVKDINKINKNGFDFLITDNNIKNLNKYLKYGITPIIEKESSFGSILNEFDPSINEGNSYLYENNNTWSLFYSLIRYLENYKFPYDNLNLVKNILKL